MTTTHDLALTRLADQPEMKARNCHFQDELVQDGQEKGQEKGQKTDRDDDATSPRTSKVMAKMHFDYRLRPGVVTKSNAVALMRAVGLRVKDHPSDSTASDVTRVS